MHWNNAKVFPASKKKQDESTKHPRPMMRYDPDNIFAKMLRGDIPVTPLLDTEHVLAFNDIAPAAPVHILVIPKGEYIDHQDFVAHAPAALQLAYQQAILALVKEHNIQKEYRLISNCGTRAGQTVFHYHTHILGGKKMTALLAN
jgi:histidine triad (HIT) family protein